MRRSVFPGVAPASVDFQAVRDQRRSRPLYVEFSLATARSIANGTTEDITDVSGKALLVRAAGNTVFSDPLYDSGGNYIAGVVVAHFEDSALGAGVSTPNTILPNAAQYVPFTTFIVENFAQVGKKARLIFGVDIDFQPGFNSQSTIAGIVSTREYGLAYGASYKSTTVMAANTSDQVFSAAANVNGGILWRATGHSRNTTNVQQYALAAHTAAPNSVTVGDVIAGTEVWMELAGGFNAMLRVDRPVFIPAGKGLFYTSSLLEANAMRSALYTLL